MIEHELVTVQGMQTPDAESFIGGRPKLPADADLPRCEFCDAVETFFFQLAFPETHPWSGLSLAVFFCTDCVEEDHLIPEMVPGNLSGAVIPAGFLHYYQRNFALLTFKTGNGVIRMDYKPRIPFQKWFLKRPLDRRAARNKVGGKPDWLLDDETPARYGAQSMVFLFQIHEEFTFDILPGAPRQVRRGFDGVEESPHPYYELFLANRLFFFGTAAPAEPAVYVLTQID